MDRTHSPSLIVDVCVPGRRRVLVGIAAALGVAPCAWGENRLRAPLRFAYARVTAAGLVAPPQSETLDWEAMSARTGELVQGLAPLPVGGLFGLAPPPTDGGASCILAARQIAAREGFGHVLLYATDGGRRDVSSHGDNWFANTFASLRADYGRHDPSTGEAHLLDTGGGQPVLSVTSDARPRFALNPLDNRNPEAEVFAALLVRLERRIVEALSPDYSASRSIAD